MSRGNASAKFFEIIVGITGAFFSRWMYPFLFTLIGLTCYIGGAVFISLMIYPHPESGFHRVPEKEEDDQPNTSSKDKTNKTD